MKKSKKRDAFGPNSRIWNYFGNNESDEKHFKLKLALKFTDINFLLAHYFCIFTHNTLFQVSKIALRQNRCSAKVH